MAQNIIPIEIRELLLDYMKDYYEEIILHRGIPDTRDGLIEAQRRLLFGSTNRKYTSDKAHVKSTKIISESMSYHAHGDASLYQCMVNMSQWWSNNILLYDTNGSNGSIYGDEPAKPRYLEARMHKNAERYMTDNLNQETVDYINTFDDSGKEPKVMPAKLPFYLINGAFGIAGGYSVNVPAHNTKEVLEEMIKYIDDENHEINLVPDLPTGGIIANDETLRNAYTTGRSKYTMRGEVTLDEKQHAVIITSLPWMTNLISYKKQLSTIIEKRKDPKGKKDLPPVIEGISKVKDASAKDDIKLILYVKKDYDLQEIEQKLYRYTNLQNTIPFIILGVVNGKFKIYTHIKQVFDEWLNFRVFTIRRIKLNNVKKWNYRIHILDALIRLVEEDILDEVITKIKACKGKAEVIEMLENDYSFSHKQAEAIAGMELYRISNTSLTDNKNERATLQQKVKEEEQFFKDSRKIELLIKDELLEALKDKKIIQERKTKIVSSLSLDLDEMDIPDVQRGIIATHEGFVKKIAPLKTQKRNGKGIKLGKLKDGDYPVSINNMNERDDMWVITKVGKVYKFPVHEFPESGQNLGTSIRSAINNEGISNVICVPKDIDMENTNILIVTKQNRIKQSPLTEYTNIFSSGLIAIKLADDDEVVGAMLIDSREPKQVVLGHSGGNAIVMSSDQVPTVGRVSMGVIAFNTDIIKEGHVVVSMDYIREDTTHMLVVTSNGMGKVVETEEFYSTKADGSKQLMNRGVKGVMAAKLKDNYLVSIKPCNMEERVTLISSSNIISIPISDIPVYKRPTFGAGIMNLNGNDEVIDVTIP